MDRRMILKYCPEDVSDSGVSLVLICYENAAESAPYLRCTTLTPYVNSKTVLSTSHLEYMEALMRDISAAANESREAALLMLNRLAAISFGPIRCFPET
jgi:hypothetical protein